MKRPVIKLRDGYRTNSKKAEEIIEDYDEEPQDNYENYDYSDYQDEDFEENQ